MSVIPFYFWPKVLRGAAKEASTLKQDSSDAFNTVDFLPFFLCILLQPVSSIMSRSSMLTEVL